MIQNFTCNINTFKCSAIKKNTKKCYDDHIVISLWNHKKEIAIEQISIPFGYADETFISQFTNKLIEYINEKFTNVTNYIIECFRIEYSKPDACYDELTKMRNVFVDCLLNNCLLNNCNDMFDGYSINNHSREDCLTIILSKRKLIPFEFKNDNVCDILLAFKNKISLPYDYCDENISYADEIHEKSGYIHKIPLRIICKRRFHVHEKKMRASHKSKYYFTSIEVTFDKPITYILSANSAPDIYFKFIVGDSDYTSNNSKLISPFSFDYRLNKLCDALEQTYLVSIDKKLCKIYGFSYYKSNNDYLNRHYYTEESRYDNSFRSDPSMNTNLCSMINKIYDNFKQN